MPIGTDDIQAALGRPTSPTDAELAQWEIWISDALLLIEARLGDPDQLDQARLAYVVREAVIAHIRRPDDATTVDVSIGRVTIRDEWWALLSDANNSASAFSIRPGGGYCAHLPWCSSMFGANYCSCGVDIAGEPIFELD
jgi:hypothetical protein